MKGLNEVPDALKHSFQRYGITSEMWDVARKADLVDHKGGKFFRPENVAVLDSPMARDAAARIHEMILEETDFAVPTPDARTRAILTGNTQRGTFWGEVTRSITMYKSFSVTVTVATIVSRWAPPSENNSDAYAADVAERLGVGVDEKLPIDKTGAGMAILRELAKAIIQHETGEQPYTDAQVEAGVEMALA